MTTTLHLEPGDAKPVIHRPNLDLDAVRRRGRVIARSGVLETTESRPHILNTLDKWEAGDREKTALERDLVPIYESSWWWEREIERALKKTKNPRVKRPETIARLADGVERAREGYAKAQLREESRGATPRATALREAERPDRPGLWYHSCRGVDGRAVEIRICDTKGRTRLFVAIPAADIHTLVAAEDFAQSLRDHIESLEAEDPAPALSIVR